MLVFKNKCKKIYILRIILSTNINVSYFTGKRGPLYALYHRRDLAPVRLFAPTTSTKDRTNTIGREKNILSMNAKINTPINTPMINILIRTRSTSRIKSMNNLIRLISTPIKMTSILKKLIKVIGMINSTIRTTSISMRNL